LAEAIFSTKKLNKFISFDRLNGILECESGVLLSEILEITVPQGYFLAITPGTKFISLEELLLLMFMGKITMQKERFGMCN
jgi:FAD/FMN-containing dehydrogenase